MSARQLKFVALTGRTPGTRIATNGTTDTPLTGYTYTDTTTSGTVTRQMFCDMRNGSYAQVGADGDSVEFVRIAGSPRAECWARDSPYFPDVDDSYMGARLLSPSSTGSWEICFQLHEGDASPGFAVTLRNNRLSFEARGGPTPFVGGNPCGSCYEASPSNGKLPFGPTVPTNKYFDWRAHVVHNPAGNASALLQWRVPSGTGSASEPTDWTTIGSISGPSVKIGYSSGTPGHYTKFGTIYTGVTSPEVRRTLKVAGVGYNSFALLDTALGWGSGGTIPPEPPPPPTPVPPPSGDVDIIGSQVFTGLTWTTMSADRTRVSIHPNTRGAIIPQRLVFYLDGLGGTAGTQTLRGVIYNAASSAAGVAFVGNGNPLVASSATKSVAANDPEGWVTFDTFAGPGAAGFSWQNIAIGLQSSTTAGVARYAAIPRTHALELIDDTFADGALAAWPLASTFDDKLMSGYLVYSLAPASPGNPNRLYTAGRRRYLPDVRIGSLASPTTRPIGHGGGL